MVVARTIAELVAAVADESPASAAIRAPDGAPLSYADLLGAMARVRATLREAGVGPRDRVALALPNGPEAAVAFLGVAAAATCAPLNPAYKPSDFAFSCRDLGVRALLLADGQVAAAEAAARELALPVLRLRPDPSGVAGLFDLQVDGGATRPANDDASPTPDDVALVLHTSGTTARPKIVPLTQRNLCASADNIRRTLALAPDDVCLNVMPLFHIHGLMAALLASLAGGASVACTSGFRAADFATWLRDLGPTWYTAVPTIHQAVLAACTDRAAVRGHRLRLVRSSSASLPPRVLHDLVALFEVPVVEAYGMTEAAHQMASNPIAPGAQKPGSVGPPAGPEVAVMDASGRLLASGEVGELVIRGETVTTGYEQNPDANAAAFTDGWFRTGDQGYIDDDGYVSLTGRLKELINRGGEKIAPREVEEALLRHPAVAQAVAFAAPHPRLGEEVAAAVVLRDGAHATPPELRETASAHLAYFKVPRRIEVVAEIPKGATGKVQRATLAQALGLVDGTSRTDGATASDARGVAPQSELETRIARVWTEMLGVASVGVDEDFFALGGDSLAAVEMIERLAELLEVDVPVGDFLEQPTIATIVAHHERSSRDELVVIRREGDEPPVFCVAAHDGRLWGVARLARHLPLDAPVYGFRAPAVDARGPLPTIGELAELNLASLARVQPEGPVRLIGACFGGTVAQEMAVRLERRGRPVELLVMLNSFNRAWRRSDVADASVALRARHLLSRVRLHASRLGARAAGERTAYLAERLALVRRHWTDEARRLAFELLSRGGLPRPRALRKVAYASRHAQHRHVAQPFAGRVLLVHATAPIAGVYPLPRLGWGELLRGDVELLELPCEQLEFWSNDDVLREVADAIATRLAPSGSAAASSGEAHLPGAA